MSSGREASAAAGAATAANAPSRDRRAEARLAALVQDAQDAVIAKDLDGVITDWNQGAERMYGYTAEEAIGRHISMLVPSNRHREERVILDRIKRGERLQTYETERIRKDGVRIDVSLTVSPIREPEHGVIGASVLARDITAELRRRHAQAFLARVAHAFHSSLDPGEAASLIVETAVPELAELCILDMVLADGSIGRPTIAAADPDVAAGLREVRREAPIDRDGSHPVAEAIRTRRSLVVADLTDERVHADVAQSERHREFITAHGYSSAVVVPLIARGRLLGTISFLHVQNDRRYSDEEVALLEDLGARAAMAIDNARLYRERADVAATLQRSLRPDQPPEIPGIETGVVFEAVGEGIEVGGDFYDLFHSGETWGLLIGDVVGKGPAAAALTGQIRHTVRALAIEGWSPARVLDRVNAVLYEALPSGTFASAQLLALRPNRGGASFELASAGHPPAALCRPGRARSIGGGTVLGVVADAQIATVACELGPRDLLLLYTDGWLDAGPVNAHRSPEAIAEEAGRDLGAPLAEILARLRADALERARGRLTDDLVLLGLRPIDARGDA